jgi:hypothetical protein
MTDRLESRKRIYGLLPLASYVLFGALVFALAHYGAQHYGDACYDRQGCIPSSIKYGVLQAVRDVDRTAPLYELGVAGMLVVLATANGAVWVARRRAVKQQPDASTDTRAT